MGGIRGGSGGWLEDSVCIPWSININNSAKESWLLRLDSRVERFGWWWWSRRLHVFGFIVIDSFTNMFGQNLKFFTLTKHRM
jgi:hypothetical protein